jgi:hypothetical protein
MAEQPPPDLCGQLHLKEILQAEGIIILKSRVAACSPIFLAAHGVIRSFASKTS